MTLTPAAIKAAQPGDELRDHVVPGLHVRVFPASRSFYLYYRTKGGRRRKPKLGDWPTLTLPRARTLAKNMLDAVAAGGDPSRARQEERTAPTVGDLCDRYMREHGDKKKSAKDDARIIRLYVRPKLGRERVADLTYDDIAAWHKGIRAKVQANRALALMSKALNLAERWHWRPMNSNPCAAVERNQERRRRRYATAEEAAAIAQALDARRKTSPHVVALLYLLIYTGARLSEIVNARWSDLRGDTLILRDHKTAGKTGDARVIHLPPQAVAELDALPRTSGTLTGIANPHKLWEAVRREAGCPDLRIHDLRHSFASAALAAGVELSQIGELLGHRSAQTTKGYAHLMDEAGRASATAAGNLIAARLTGPRNQTPT
ncbi:MAG: site-specific integrase [Rhodospirillaceae bacterium]